MENVLAHLQMLLLQFRMMSANVEKKVGVSIFMARKGVKAKKRSTLQFIRLLASRVRANSQPRKLQSGVSC